MLTESEQTALAVIDNAKPSRNEKVLLNRYLKLFHTIEPVVKRGQQPTTDQTAVAEMALELAHCALDRGDVYETGQRLLVAIMLDNQKARALSGLLKSKLDAARKAANRAVAEELSAVPRT